MPGLYVVSEFGKLNPQSMDTADFAELCRLTVTLAESQGTAASPPLVWGRDRNGEYVQAQEYVGVIALPNGTQIEILPKIARIHQEVLVRRIFLKMLSCLQTFRYLQLPLSRLSTARLPLFEVFIAAFIEKTETLVRGGLKSAYVSVEENLPFYKGRLRMPEHLRHNLVHRERFYVCYDEFLPDRAENRLIKATLSLLLRLTRNADHARRLRTLFQAFDAVHESVNYDRDFAAVALDRSMKVYEGVLEWCAVFLRRLSFTPHSGKNKALSLLFPMHELFESYMARKIKEHYQPQGYDVCAQDKRYSLFEHPGCFALKPDIVIYQAGVPVLILDTKWKMLTTERYNGISQGDMYQMYAYAHRYGLSGGMLPPVMLLYPWSLESLANDSFSECARAGAHVSVYQVPLQDELLTELWSRIDSLLQPA